MLLFEKSLILNVDPAERKYLIYPQTGEGFFRTRVNSNNPKKSIMYDYTLFICIGVVAGAVYVRS